jgi:MoxR-like ATPase
VLEKLLKLYTMAMAYDVRSPVPHLFGPPGCGKSTVAEELAELVGKKLHIVNVSRLSPLEIEGVQMPYTDEFDKQKLVLLLATLWNQLEEGDIILWDEFLRGFPEVYNALLDIFTSREVAGHKLPNVFMLAASNSTVSYDKALEDRLLHLPVPDPRNSRIRQKQLGQLIVDALGLMPNMADSAEMQALLIAHVMPMYDVLDELKGKGNSSSSKGVSVRNIIGQSKLREIKLRELKELLVANNNLAVEKFKAQYVFLPNGRDVPEEYEAQAIKLAAEADQLRADGKLSEIHELNLDLNLQLIELEAVRKEKGDDEDDDVFVEPDPF